MKRFLLAISIVALLFGCSANKPAAAVAPPKAAIGSFGLDTGQMDTSIKPGDDFYKYVNGKWLATFKMPPDKASYYTFDALTDKAENDVHTILDELAKTPPAAGSMQKKVLDLYNSWM